jgi:hypothetical protein
MSPVSFSFLITFPYKQPSGHSQLTERWGFHTRAGPSFSANADGSADDEQDGTAQSNGSVRILKRPRAESD